MSHTSEAIAALKYLAIMPQAYHARGPEWLAREMGRVAGQYADLLSRPASYRRAYWRGWLHSLNGQPLGERSQGYRAGYYSQRSGGY